MLKKVVNKIHSSHEGNDNMNLYGFINFIFWGNVFGSIASICCLISDLNETRIRPEDIKTDLTYFAICTCIVLLFIFVFKWLKDKNIGGEEY
jgi:hypothetical protein